MDFWNDISTRKSWDLLKELNKQFNFVVIGGWGIYLWTHSQKSKDIDFIIEWKDLEKIKENYEPKKNDRLKKYEIVVDEVDVDIYLPHYSKFLIPAENLIKLNAVIEGFNVLKPEPLLILKQQALRDRKDSIKGQKDRIDVLSLLISETINFNKYQKILEEYKLWELNRELEKMIKLSREDFKYLNITNPRKIKQLKENWIKNLE